MTPGAISVRCVADFHDDTLTPEIWNGLLRQGASDVVFLTWEWQATWWKIFGAGQLLLMVAERDGRDVAVAPLYTEGGMIYFVGSGGSDYLDFIGDTSDDGTIWELLSKAKDIVPVFLGFVFYHIRDDSRTGKQMLRIAEALGMRCFNEGDLPAPAMDMGGGGSSALEASRKKSLRRHENFFRRNGRLEVQHATRETEILPWLDLFFQQHIDRWSSTDSPSLFCDDANKSFYRQLATMGSKTGWLRFTRVSWNERPIAFHFGMCYHGRYLWYKPSFAIELAKKSPGEVLIRQLLLAAMAEGATEFDLGVGDEPFKRRFANRVQHVRTWGLYQGMEPERRK